MAEFIVPRLEKLDSQPEVQALLKGLLNQGAVKTFLWAGPEGSGKKTYVLALARSLFCREGPDCGGCPTCKQVLNKTHPDLFWVDQEHFWAEKEKESKSSQITVPVAQYLSEKLNQAPFSAPYKIAVIPEAENLNILAQNVLLKTLEEPPANTILILLARKTGGFLPTVLSRCRVVRFGALPSLKIEDILIQTYGWEQSKARQAAEGCGGNLGLALKFTDEHWSVFVDKVQSDFDKALAGPDELWLQMALEYDKMEPEFLEETLSASQRKVEVLQAALQIYISVWSRRLSRRGPVPEKLTSLVPSQVLQCLQMHLDLIPSHVPPKMIFDHLFLQLKQGFEKGEIKNDSFMEMAVQI